MDGKSAGLPPAGLFACFSGGSNTGTLAGLAALEVVRRLGSNRVGLCSLPATLNQVPRQSALLHRISKIVVVDGCHNACARQLLAGVGIQPNAYLNLEEGLGIAKKGPFTGLAFTEREVQTVAEALIALIEAEERRGEPVA